MKYDKIGVAGYMGSGKSTLCRFLEDFGYRRIDADTEAKSVMNSDRAIQSQIADSFGSGTVVNGLVDFALLGQIVFADYNALETLNTIVQPTVRDHVTELVRSSREAIILDAALLGIWGIESLFDAVWWVYADQQTRAARICERNSGLGPERVEQRMGAQEATVPAPPVPPWVLLNNDGTLDDLRSLLERTIDAPGEPAKDW